MIESLDLIDFMNRWASQAGYPVVTVLQYQKFVKVSQKRFGRSTTNDSKWTIPLNFATNYDNADFTQTVPMYFFDHDHSGMYTINLTHVPNWIIFNVQQIGLQMKRNRLKPFIVNSFLSRILSGKLR